MASRELFTNAPAFPSNLPVAKIPSISLAKLAHNDTSESEAVFVACRTLGFFQIYKETKRAKN